MQMNLNTIMKLIPTLTETQVQRFHKRVSVGSQNECWPWTGRLTDDGYGEFDVLNRTLKAHRVAYFVANQEQPGANLVTHSCDNPPCCNPSHLKLGTKQSNADEAAVRGRIRNGVTAIKNLEETLREVAERLNTLTERIEHLINR